VVVDHVLDVNALVQDGVPALRLELRAVFRGLTEVGVVVEGEAVGPADVAIRGVPARPRRHEERAQVDGNLRDVLAVFGGVFAARHVATAPPGLVAHAPVLDVEGLPVAVGGALFGLWLR